MSGFGGSRETGRLHLHDGAADGVALRQPIVRVENLVRTYRLGAEDVHALRGANLTVERGEFVAIMGPSGSGKSTFLNQIGCLDRPTSGHYYLAGTDIAGLSDDELAEVRGRTIGFVFQRFNLLARTSAYENVGMPLIYQGARADSTRVSELLRAVGLPDRGGHRPQELSGGEQQRIAFARALVNNPVLILADEPTGNLDSERGEEIMRLLCDLNRAGMTIILVTHEEPIARYAGRIIRFQDGRIQSDEPVPERIVPEPGGFSLPSLDGAPIVREHTWHARFGNMRQYMSSAVRSLAVNRLRAGLTMLGILIGVAAVIALISLGQGAQADVQARIERLGTNLINVTPDQSRTWGPAAGNRLTWQHADLIRESIQSVSGVAPELTERTTIRYGRESRTYEVVGTTGDFAGMRDWNVAHGRFLADADVRSRAQVVVLGSGVADDLFDYVGPVGRRIRIGASGYEVIGVLEEQGGRGFQNPDNRVYIPVTTAARRVTGSEQVRSIAVQVDDRANMQSAAVGISEVLRADIGRRSDGGDLFLVTTQDDVLSTMQEVTRTLTALLASIAGISLLVGGIGIMNIMLVSVSERTREIGIRKAVGARRSDLLAQFLSEAVLLSGAGGALGWLLGVGVARVVSNLMDVSTIVSMETIVIAVGFSVLVGVFFGWYPAQKAASLDPIEALRYE